MMTKMVIGVTFVIVTIIVTIVVDSSDEIAARIPEARPGQVGPSFYQNDVHFPSSSSSSSSSSSLSLFFS